MAQERPITPEKQLLKLIEDPDSAGKPDKKEIAKRRGLALISPGAWKGKLAFLKDSFKKSLKGASLTKLDIKAINRILLLCIFILLFFLIGSYSMMMINLKDVPNFKFEPRETAAQLDSPATSVLKNSASYYAERVRDRDIFKMLTKRKRVIEDAPAEAAPSSAALETLQRFKLVGISWSNDPDAMIEDTGALKTFFVKRGQMVGDVKVEAILKDKVVLSYKGEEVELR